MVLWEQKPLFMQVNCTLSLGIWTMQFDVMTGLEEAYLGAVFHGVPEGRRYIYLVWNFPLDKIDSKQGVRLRPRCWDYYASLLTACP